MPGLTIPRPRESYAEELLDPPWGEVIDQWRDAHWLRAIETALRQPNSRVLVFAGAGHFGYETEHSNINELLARAGYSSVVVGFAGGDFIPEDGEDDAIRISSDAQSPSRDCDWMIHLSE